MENHSDTESAQLLGDWDSLPPAVKDTRKERGASTSTAGVGRVLPPWADPSYEWGGGKWKIDGRKNKNKNKEKEKVKEEEKESDLSIEDLMKEYSSLPPQIAEWYWCIEYVAKFHKDLRCLFDLMNMGYPCTDDYGSRINEVVSLRILESLFDPTKTDAATVVGPRIEFDFSLSSTHVLYTILQHITVSEARPGMPELSKFNLLPFIAHKNMSLPLCALEMLRDVSAMENNSTSAASPTVEPNDPLYRDDQPEQMDVCEEQQAHTGLEQTNIHVEDNVVVIDHPMQTNEGDEVIVIDGNDTSAEKPINNDGNTTAETSSSSSDVRVKCTKDGAWLICGSSDDESDMVKGPGLVKNTPPRQENVCWKCEREGGALLTCSKSDCATKVHKECLNCPVNFDEHKHFHCPICWYGRATKEYMESQQLKSCAKRRLAKFLPLLCRASKRLK